MRANLGPVDQWRAIESLSSDNWTDEAIGSALALPVRTIKKLRLLAHLHPPMLDHIEKGDMPSEPQLRTITAADNAEQASVWKKHRPKRNDTNVDWQSIATALQKRRLYAQHAKFGPEEEQAFGITWEDDLFLPADEDTRYTTNAEAFMAAQTAWLEANLPKNGAILPVDEYGNPKLPPKSERIWTSPKRSDTIGFYIDTRNGAVKEIAFRTPKPEPKTNKKKNETTNPVDEIEPKPSKTRADITAKGMEMIGDFRTAALSKALLENPLDDSTLLGLLVLGFTANNVEIRSSDFVRGIQRTILQRMTEGGHLTQDPTIIRHAAREILAASLSCLTNYHTSGLAARFAGDAIGADAHLPDMATDEFLSCISKPALERAATAAGVTPRQRAKETRAALIAEKGETPFILPAATFAPTEAELAAHKDHAVYEFNNDSEEDDGATHNEPASSLDESPFPEPRHINHGESGSDFANPALPD